MIKKVTILFLILLSISCNVSNSGMSIEEFEIKQAQIEKQNKDSKTLYDGWYHQSEDINDFLRINELSTDSFFLDPKPIVLIENFIRGEGMTTYAGNDGYTVYFDEPATVEWSEATKKFQSERLVFIMDDKVVSAPIIASQVSAGICVFWNESTSKEYLKKIKELLKD